MNEAADREIVLITGCPRSGTTAFVSVLNHHPHVGVGNERFAELAERGGLDRGLFEPSRYVTFEPGDCAPAAFDNGLTVWARNKVLDLRVIGDKIPDARSVFASARDLGPVKIIVILRDPYSIARSFQNRAEKALADGSDHELWPVEWGFEEAVRRFNETLQTVATAVTAKQKNHADHKEMSLLVVHYEDVFDPSVDLGFVFEFLGVDPALLSEEGVADAKSWRSDATIHRNHLDNHVAMHADFAGYRNLVELCNSAWH